MVDIERAGGVRRRALDIIGRHQPIPPLVFSKKMWPRAKARGEPKVMEITAKSFVSRMCEEGLVSETDHGFILTAWGMSLRDKLLPTRR